MILFESLEEAVKCENLDDAVYLIQESIGQTDGFNASIFFSGGDVEKDWIRLNKYDKLEILARYVSYEIRNLYTHIK